MACGRAFSPLLLKWPMIACQALWKDCVVSAVLRVYVYSICGSGGSSAVLFKTEVWRTQLGLDLAVRAYVAC